MSSGEGYEAFARQVRETKIGLGRLPLTAAKQGKSVAGYGAPGKSATLLHYCGIGKDMIEYTVDRSPYKQGRFLRAARFRFIIRTGSRDQAGLRHHSSLESEG